MAQVVTSILTICECCITNMFNVGWNDAIEVLVDDKVGNAVGIIVGVVGGEEGIGEANAGWDDVTGVIGGEERWEDVDDVRRLLTLISFIADFISLPYTKIYSYPFPLLYLDLKKFTVFKSMILFK